MENNVDLPVALNILERKIANLTIKYSEEKDAEVEKELKKYLDIKKEIYKGNVLLIKKLINNEDVWYDRFKRKNKKYNR